MLNVVDGRAYQALALAVVKRAVDDLLPGVRLSPRERDSAIRLLDNRGGELAAWCDLAGVEVTVIQRAARRLLRRDEHAHDGEGGALLDRPLAAGGAAGAGHQAAIAPVAAEADLAGHDVEARCSLLRLL